jgi:coenzyme F420-0:L-glutamate ligase/coenzyme F420-1:gamma-L-glutamate ligase
MTQRFSPVCLIPVPFRVDVHPGDSIGAELLKALGQNRLRLKRGDIVVIKHKIISKAEGQLVRLSTVHPSPRARSWARRYNLDPRVIELALKESARIVRQKNGVLITETRHLRQQRNRCFQCGRRGACVASTEGSRQVSSQALSAIAQANRLSRSSHHKRYVWTAVAGRFDGSRNRSCRNDISPRLPQSR